MDYIEILFYTTYKIHSLSLKWLNHFTFCFKGNTKKEDFFSSCEICKTVDSTISWDFIYVRWWNCLLLSPKVYSNLKGKFRRY